MLYRAGQNTFYSDRLLTSIGIISFFHSDKDGDRSLLESLLYAEVYVICMIVVGLLLYWSLRGDTRSTSERWLIRTLGGFLLNFTANLCFTLFNNRLIPISNTMAAAYFFKTMYFITLDLSVFSWMGYAETELHSSFAKDKRWQRIVFGAAAIPILVALVNLWTRHMFYIDEGGAYRRVTMYHFVMLFLFACTMVSGVRLVYHARFESDPNQRGHMRLTASFPLCILAAWLLPFIGEAFPVICVSVMVELLCLYTGTSTRQISMDKLTQVNNRQNLIGFMNYKLRNHEESLYLLMIDVDEFKPINDTYGHLEGDNALVRVATALKRACAPYKKRPYIARYGGDEFIVMMEGSGQELNNLQQDIIRQLDAVQPADAPYQLKVSIGSAEHQPGMEPKELIAAADAGLYEIKRARKAGKR